MGVEPTLYHKAHIGPQPVNKIRAIVHLIETHQLFGPHLVAIILILAFIQDPYTPQQPMVYHTVENIFNCPCHGTFIYNIFKFYHVKIVQHMEVVLDLLEFPEFLSCLGVLTVEVLGIFYTLVAPLIGQQRHTKVSW